MSTLPTRKIIHVDMDAFFAAVEMQDNPTLANIPLAVGGSTDRRGVISTCNYQARKFGVRSAMPTAKALRLCPNLTVVPGRMDRYREVSRRMREILARYTDVIEPLSLDEAFLDVSESPHFRGSATHIAEAIRWDIKSELGLTASAGVAPLKFLAKIASDINKPDGLTVIQPNEVERFIEQLELNKVPGVGAVTWKRLQSLGFRSGGDIRASSEHALNTLLGKFGRVLWHRCQGIDERTISPYRERKSVGVERTFGVDLNSLEAVILNYQETLLPEFTQRSKRYFEANQVARIGIKLKFADFSQTTREQAIGQLNHEVLLQLLSAAYLRGNGLGVRLIGVHCGLTPLKPSGVTEQLPLFN
ncbi:DNA polymerase IV [Umboniibacter marinipuniceus]|uniref:DNA polymerase IV n=1 Tax=Umboniibacter marinipuniceus TaxID=569599 RepID=A0A3M0A6D3_9GAMM|nr:DNA polymerase IV [Umboniibacter marinipuniceus]RMA80147.1 DNA polymerase-4 [Umboniibacter marinipuniceus]